jgi:DNA polymerase-3 subunit delta
MQVRPADLSGHLRGSLAPAYLICGDETLLVEEACDAVLHTARSQGFGERSILFAEGSFSWNDVIQDAASMSLFAEKRVVDVRVPGGKLDREASEAVRRYAGHPSADTLLMVRMRRLEKGQSTSAWYTAMDKLGVVVPVWPVDVRELPRWLSARLKQAGLSLDKDALALLAERVEGNLLAAVQEIEKLKLAGLDAPVTVEALMSVLEDAARYDAFELIDATLAGDARRVARMVPSLRQEGVNLLAILGALTSQLRRIVDGGYMPPQRKRVVSAFLERIGSAAAIERVLAECCLVDAQTKGQIPGDAWLSLEDVLLRLAGARPMAGGSPVRFLR